VGEIAPLINVNIKGVQSKISVVCYEKRHSSSGTICWRFATNLDAQLSRKNDKGRRETLLPNDFNTPDFWNPVSVKLKDGRQATVIMSLDGTIRALTPNKEEIASIKDFMHFPDHMDMDGAILHVVAFDPLEIGVPKIVEVP
jgi:hypothetical protein